MSPTPQLAVQSLLWTGHSLKVLDQRVLPQEIRYDEYRNAADVAHAIAGMRVRGAPAIGIAAAYGVALSAMTHLVAVTADWREAILRDIELLPARGPPPSTCSGLWRKCANDWRKPIAITPSPASPRWPSKSTPKMPPPIVRWANAVRIYSARLKPC